MTRFNEKFMRRLRLAYSRLISRRRDTAILISPWHSMRLMSPFPASFRAKLMAVAGVLLVVIVLMAAMFYYSTQRYQYHLESSTAANRVLVSYQAVSDHTYRKLNAVGEIVDLNDVGDVTARQANERLLWDAVYQVRESLQAKDLIVPESMSGRVDHLGRIESLTERIIQSGATIRDAIQSGDRIAAQQELRVLRSDAVAGQFNQLIDEALAQERAVVASTQQAAIELGRSITRVLPIAIGVILLFGSLVGVWMSRSLTRSVQTLEEAANRYSSGDLEYRSPMLAETEFAKLGSAFNHMAEELAARRRESERSQESLEAQVAERTRELEHTLGQLELADAGRRRLLADISHELRTPLTIIQGEADMALRGPEKTSSTYQDALQRVRDQVKHTTRLVKDLLFVARTEEGNARLEVRSVALTQLLRDVCADFRSTAAKKQLTIEERYLVPDCTVAGDEGRLRQVFAILIDNAIRYSYEGAPITLTMSDSGERIRISIENSGIGLSEEEAVKAFDRFYRGESATAETEGTGLGLPVAKAIIDAHKGEISLIGVPDSGATAIVELPLELTSTAVA